MRWDSYIRALTSSVATIVLLSIAGCSMLVFIWVLHWAIR